MEALVEAKLFANKLKKKTDDRKLIPEDDLKELDNLDKRYKQLVSIPAEELEMVDVRKETDKMQFQQKSLMDVKHERRFLQQRLKELKIQAEEIRQKKEMELSELENLVNTKKNNLNEIQETKKIMRRQVDQRNDELLTLKYEGQPILSEDCDLTKTIRRLENRLDKAVIKYNEAKNIQNTYELILERLSKERMSFEEELKKYKRTAVSKEKDYTEIENNFLIISQEVENLQQEFAKTSEEFVEQEQDQKNLLDQKKKQFEALLQSTKELSKQFAENEKKRKKEKEKLEELKATDGKDTMETLQAQKEKHLLREQSKKFAILKEKTGAKNEDGVIQAFLSLDENKSNLDQIVKQNQKKIEALHKIFLALQTKKNSILLSKTEGSKKIMNEIDDKLRRSTEKMIDAQKKFESLTKSVVSARAGLEHLVEIMMKVQLPMEPLRVPQKLQRNMKDKEYIEILSQHCQKKIDKLHQVCEKELQNGEDKKIESLPPSFLKSFVSAHNSRIDWTEEEKENTKEHEDLMDDGEDDENSQDELLTTSGVKSHIISAMKVNQKI